MSLQLRHQRAMEVFEAICDLPVDVRTTALNERCGEDHELRGEVEMMLHHDASPLDLLMQHGAGGVVEMLAADLASGDASGDDRPPSVDMPSQIGEFRILRKIGEGGMGDVYLAQQDRPQRTVALKLIRSELSSSTAASRFEHEAHVLGMLIHPGIARIYQVGSAAPVMPDGSSTGTPQSIFAMEYIDGLPITQYADAHHLNTRQRLELMMQVCRAVEYAHQKGVIHRDLKPSNILVVEDIQETAQSPNVSFVQSRAAPKILDFGVARLTDSDLQITTIQTDVGQLIGTLQYMSPEQVSTDPAELDTRSDVYALGIVMYELLSRRLPYDLLQKPMHEATRIIREVEPTRMSATDRTLRGDIETIALKALDKDKTHRYQSAADLAEDIRRYLVDEPISARPHSTMYHLRKFARRNRVLAGGIVGVVLAILTGIIGTTLGMIEARRQRDDAHRQTRIAQAINEFITDDLLAQADPSPQANRDLTLRQALDNAAAGIQGRFADEPLIEAGVRVTLGETYAGLGEYDLAKPHLERVVIIRESVLGADHRDTMQAMLTLANTLREQANETEAENIYQRVMGSARQLFGPDDELVMSAKDGVGLLRDQQSRFDEAGQLFAEVLATRERTLGDEHLETLTSMSNLTTVYQSQGRSDEAEAMQRRIVEISRRVLGPDHPKTLLSLNILASTLMQQRKMDEAEPLLVQCYEGYRKKYGDAHTDTLASMNNLANIYFATKRFDDAATMANRSLDAARELYGDHHLEVALVKGTLANIYRWQKQFAEAEPLALQTYEWMTSHFGPDHPYVRQATEIVIRVYDQWGKPEIAAQWKAKLPQPPAAPPATQPSPKP